MILCLIMVLGLGFRSSNEINISNVLIIVLTFFLISTEHFRFNKGKASKYIIWYFSVVSVCVFSLMWAKVNTWNYVYALIKDTYIPLICFIVCLEIYLKKNTPVELMNCLIIAEMLVMLRAIINTPWTEMFQSLDSRLFASGLGRNYNDFTTQMTLVSLVVSYMSFYVEKKYKKVYLIFMVFIIISASRKAMVVSVLGYIMIYLCSSSIDIKKLIKRCAILLVILGGFLFVIFNNSFLYSLVGEKLMSMIQSIGMSSSEMLGSINSADIDHSMHGRAVLREEAFEQFLQNPVLGIGYYNFQYFNRYGLYAHNNYLELLADLGLTGFVLYYSMYFAVSISSAKKVLNRQDKSAFFKFTLIYLILLLVMEYAQITFFRLFALMPTIIVFRLCDYYNNKKWGNISEEFR